VVSGLTLSAAAAVSHDLYANVICHGDADRDTELKISRITTLVIGLMTMGLAILLEGENVAVLALITGQGSPPVAHWPVVTQGWLQR